MQEYFLQIVATGILIVLLPIVKYMMRKVVRRYAIMNKKLESRTKHITRIFSTCINLLFIITVITIWGVDPHNLLVAVSSIFAVIGVAMFAQWSLLSNITAGILIFFTSQFRIGDYIRILDKDMPIDARVEDIKSFHTLLRNRNGETITYPNSLFFQKGVSIIHIEGWDDDDTE